METAEDDEETEQVMAEFDFIVGSEGNVGELIASSYGKRGIYIYEEPNGQSVNNGSQV